MGARSWSPISRSSRFAAASRSRRGRTAIPSIPCAGTFIPNTNSTTSWPPSGRYFVGDFIGEFEPGNLVLTGPNLPHNWVSDLPEGVVVPLRCRIVQFSEDFIGNAMKVLPELERLRPGARAEPARRAVHPGDRRRDRADRSKN